MTAPSVSSALPPCLPPARRHSGRWADVPRELPKAITAKRAPLRQLARYRCADWGAGGRGRCVPATLVADLLPSSDIGTRTAQRLLMRDDKSARVTRTSTQSHLARERLQQPVLLPRSLSGTTVIVDRGADTPRTQADAARLKWHAASARPLDRSGRPSAQRPTLPPRRIRSLRSHRAPQFAVRCHPPYAHGVSTSPAKEQVAATGVRRLHRCSPDLHLGHRRRRRLPFKLSDENACGRRPQRTLSHPYLKARALCYCVA